MDWSLYLGLVGSAGASLWDTDSFFVRRGELSEVRKAFPAVEG